MKSDTKLGSLVLAIEPSASSLYVIYERPRDFDGKVPFLVRKWGFDGWRFYPTALTFAADSLDEARARLSEFARAHGSLGEVFAGKNLGREADDDPVIVETWA
jgi:hypothetical protein